MSTLYFPNHLITIKRPHNIGGIKYALSATYTAFPADIQPQTQERVNQSGGRVGKTYDGYVDSTVDIREGDKVLTEDGKQYAVKAISTYSGAGLLDHTQLILESED